MQEKATTLEFHNENDFFKTFVPKEYICLQTVNHYRPGEIITIAIKIGQTINLSMKAKVLYSYSNSHNFADSNRTLELRLLPSA